MRLVIQRVNSSTVYINKKLFSQIGPGLLVLLGIEENDSEEDVNYLSHKLVNMRIFPDHENKMNLEVKQVNGDVLVVSQFTLHASTKKGNRPSFIKSAKPEKAIPLYEKFISQTSMLLGKSVKTGEFGADMQIELVNSGPVTILLDSKNKE